MFIDPRSVVEPFHLQKRLSPLQVQQLSDGDLHARLTMFKEAIGSINLQLASYNAGENDRTRSWWYTARKAKEAYQADLAIAKAEAQQRQKPTQPGMARDRGHAFVIAARVVLDKETIRRIWAVAEERDPGLFPEPTGALKSEQGEAPA